MACLDNGLLYEYLDDVLEDEYLKIDENEYNILCDDEIIYIIELFPELLQKNKYIKNRLNNIILSKLKHKKIIKNNVQLFITA